MTFLDALKYEVRKSPPQAVFELPTKIQALPFYRLLNSPGVRTSNCVSVRLTMKLSVPAEAAFRNHAQMSGLSDRLHSERRTYPVIESLILRQAYLPTGLLHDSQCRRLRHGRC